MEIKQFVALRAFIFFEGKVLLVRESNKYSDGANAGLYDVVGGRVKPGENFKVSLIREIEEEIGVEVTVGKAFAVAEWRPVVRGEQWQIIGSFFECSVSNPNIILSKDHDEYLWINPTDYKKYNIIPTLIPVFEEWMKFHN